jgi:hypothetical protein
MLAIIAACLVGGFVLGLRFRVLVLVPVILVCIVVIAGVGIALRAGLWPIAIAIIITAFGVQVGYLIGICTAFALKPKGNGASGGPAGPTAFSFLDRAASSRRTPSPPDKS